MKTLFTLLTLLLTINLFSQSDTTKIYQVSDQKFLLIKYDQSGDLLERGYYLVIDGELEPHGKWVHFNQMGKTVAHFDEGVMMKIKLYDGSVYTKSEIEVEKLKLKIEKLETLLATN